MNAKILRLVCANVLYESLLVTLLMYRGETIISTLLFGLYKWIILGVCGCKENNKKTEECKRIRETKKRHEKKEEKE